MPHLNYGILAWGHQAKRLNLIQKRAVRILTASKYNSHTEPLFKQTNILKVSDICTLNEIKLYYKLINKQLPQYFNSFTCEANSDIHGYNTRSRNKLHLPKTNHNFAQNNLRYRIIQTLNKLPDNVIRKMYTHSIYGLRNILFPTIKLSAPSKTVTYVNAQCGDYLRLSPTCPSLYSSSGHPYHSGRNVMLDRCLTALMGEPGRLCVGDRAGLPGLCVFLGNTSVVLTWAGTGRVDISVQLMVGFVILLLHYKCRP